MLRSKHHFPFSISSQSGKVAMEQTMKEEEMQDMKNRALLASLMTAIQTDVKLVHFNPKQNELLLQRCRIIYHTLLKIPNFQPTPRLMSVFRSAEYLMRRHHRGNWKMLLTTRFTADELFNTIFEGIKHVWSLQSTLDWPKEHKEAIQKDEERNLQLLQSHLIIGNDEKSISDTLGRYHRRKVTGWKIDVNRLVAKETVQLGRLYSPPLQDDSKGDVGTEDNDDPQPSDSKGKDKTTSTSVPPHFEIRPYLLDGLVPIIVKELNYSVSITPLTLESFVTDMNVRNGWCHPNIVPFIGAYAERFDCTGFPFLCLGFVMEDLTQRGYLSLHSLLYEKGQKFSMCDAIDIVLRVADAIQYTQFSSDVKDEVLRCWMCSTAPSNVLVSSIDHGLVDDQTLTSESSVNPDIMSIHGVSHIELGNVHHPDWTTTSSSTCVATSVTSPMEESEEEKYVLDSHARWYVKISPYVFVEGGHVSRWRPHPSAVQSGCYSLTTLLIATLSNLHPHRHCKTQNELSQIYAEPDTPPNFSIPSTLPVSVQSLLRRGYALKGDTSVQGFKSIHEFQCQWEAVLHTQALQSLPDVLASTPQAPVEGDLPDYGIMADDVIGPHAI